MLQTQWKHYLLRFSLPIPSVNSEDYSPGASAVCHSHCTAKPTGGPGEWCGPSSAPTVQYQHGQGQDLSILACHLIWWRQTQCWITKLRMGAGSRTAAPFTFLNEYEWVKVLLCRTKTKNFSSCQKKNKTNNLKAGSTERERANVIKWVLNIQQWTPLGGFRPKMTNKCDGSTIWPTPRFFSFGVGCCFTSSWPQKASWPCLWAQLNKKNPT